MSVTHTVQGSPDAMELCVFVISALKLQFVKNIVASLRSSFQAFLLVGNSCASWVSSVVHGAACRSSVRLVGRR